MRGCLAVRILFVAIESPGYEEHACITWGLMLALTAAVYAQAPKHSAAARAKKSDSVGDLFVWSRPVSIANAINRPFTITQSTTCRFKKGLAASFQKVISNQERNPPERIYYGGAGATGGAGAKGPDSKVLSLNRPK